MFCITLKMEMMQKKEEVIMEGCDGDSSRRPCMLGRVSGSLAAAAPG